MAEITSLRLPRKERRVEKPVEAPKRRRRNSPVRMPQKRFFASGKVTAITEDWTPVSLPIDRAIHSTLKLMIDRSREMEVNHPYTAQFLEILASQVIGKEGIQLQCRVRTTKDELNDTVNRQIQHAWALWGEKASVNGRLSWVDLQQLAIRTVARDGEALVRRHIGTKANRYQFGLELVDVLRLDMDFNGYNPKEQTVIRMGVEMDYFGCPVAYHILNRRKDDITDGRPLVRERVPADQIIHLFRQTFPDQSRGYPWTCAVMPNAKNLEDAIKAEVAASKASAYKLGFIEKAANTVEDVDLDEAGVEGTVVREMDLHPNSVTELLPGETFKDWNPTHPNGAFKDFTKLILQGTAAGLHVSYPTLSSDLQSTSYSSGRIGTIAEREYFRNLQAWMARNLNARVYEWWIEHVVTNGLIGMKGKNPENFKNVAWKPKGFAFIDAKKDFEPWLKLIEYGLMSRTQVMSELGLDIREVFADLDREEQLAEEYGITIWPVARQEEAPADEPEQEPTDTPQPGGTDEVTEAAEEPVEEGLNESNEDNQA